MRTVTFEQRLEHRIKELREAVIMKIEEIAEAAEAASADTDGDGSRAELLKQINAVCNRARGLSMQMKEVKETLALHRHKQTQEAK